MPSKIEWCNETWEPVTGCSVLTPGCTNCYAMRLAGTRLKHNAAYEGLTAPSKAGPVWRGETRFNEKYLDKPRHWRKPRRIFVCSRGDLFHETVPDEWIARVFQVMAQCPPHTFQVLTKRADRMRAFVQGCANGDGLGWITHNGAAPKGYGGDGIIVGSAKNWPLPNVQLGVSVEDQAWADARIPILLDTPAAVRWISAEPLLGPVDLTEFEVGEGNGLNAFDALSGVGLEMNGNTPYQVTVPHLDWVVVGGESGPGARTFDVQWAKSIIDQCGAAGVPCFVKQLGADPIDSMFAEVDDVTPWRLRENEPRIRDPKGGDPAEWPEDLRVREYPK